MRLSFRSEYFIVSLSPDAIRGVRFRRAGSKYRAVSFASSVPEASDPAEALRHVLHELSYRMDAFLILTGVLADGEYFRTECDSALAPKDRKTSLEFELSRHVLKVPDEAHFQFACYPLGDADSKNYVSGCVFGKLSLDRVAALLTQSKAKADEYISPLLCIKPFEPAAYMPDIEKDYAFIEGEWRKCPAGDPPDNGYFKDIFSKSCILPSDASFKFEEYLPVLLVLRFLTSQDYAENAFPVRALPQKLKPSRYKIHLVISVILLVLTGGLYFSDAVVSRMGRYRESKDLFAELNNSRKKTSALQNEYKKSEKDRKEFERVLKMNPGMGNALGVLETITNLLPKDVLATYIRFGDSTIDLTLQTESANANLQQTLRAMDGWKVSQFNQRTVNEKLTMITLRLTREDPSARDKEKSSR